MSIHQVEEYYIQISIAGANELDIDAIHEVLSLHGSYDFEFTDASLIIESIYDKHEAKRIDDSISKIMEKVNKNRAGE